MTDKEKIRAEIERLREESVKGFKSLIEAGACILGLNMVESFLDTLEEPNAADKKAVKEIVKTTSKEVTRQVKEIVERLQEPGVDLEKEIDRVIADYSFTKTIDSGGFKTTILDYPKIARHFFELGKNAK